MNEKRRLQESSLDLTNSDKGVSHTKKLKRSSQFVLELKLDKKWIANSTSLHESLNLLSASQGQMQSSQTKENALSALLCTSIQPEDVFKISEFTNQCTIIKHDLDPQNNVVKIYMHPNKNFDFEKTYSTPTNVEIRSQGSTNYTENDPAFDQELGSSCFQLHHFEVGQICQDGL